MGDAQVEHDRHTHGGDQTDGDGEATFGQRQTDAAAHAVPGTMDEAVPLALLLPERLHDPERAQHFVHHAERGALQPSHFA